MSSAARKAREALRDRAYRLGSIDAYAERPLRDMADGGSAWLMDELGEHGPTTGRNADYRGRLCDAYEDGYRAAYSALGTDVMGGTCPLCAVLPGWPHVADCPNRREGGPAYEDIARA